MKRNISATTDALSVHPGKLVNVPYAKYILPAFFFDSGPMLLMTEPSAGRLSAAMKEEGADAISVTGAAENSTHRRFISELSEGSQLPVSCPFLEYLEGGALGRVMSYGVSVVNEFRRIA
jgi:hypothetical protein